MTLYQSQRVSLAVGLLLIGVSGLYPPWTKTTTTYTLETSQMVSYIPHVSAPLSYGSWAVESEGDYAPIFNPPRCWDWSRKPPLMTDVSFRINMPRLVTQWVIIAALAVALALVCKS